MNRPLTSVERRAFRRRQFWIDAEEKARKSRGEKGAMEFWLQAARAQMATEVRAGRPDTWAGFALVCRLLMTAMQQRAQGERRIWDDLLQYAQQVVTAHPPE